MLCLPTRSDLIGRQVQRVGRTLAACSGAEGPTSCSLREMTATASRGMARSTLLRCLSVWPKPRVCADAGRYRPAASLSFVGCNGCAPFPSMIVEWNPQTVKRRPGKPLDVVLDTGLCIGGIYKAA